MCKKLYVSNLSRDIDDSALRQVFSDHGTVDSAKVIINRATGRSRGFGFVEMNKEEDAKAAITALNGKDCGGNQLKVDKANPHKFISQRVGCGAPF
jgi:RNA recognition motif-containing protein